MELYDYLSEQESGIEEEHPRDSGKRLKMILRKYGMKQKEAAERLHYQANHISMICAGKRRLTPDVARTICGWFPGLRMEYLLCEDDYPTVKEYYEALKLEKAFNEGWNEAAVISDMLEALGYSFSFDTNTDCHISKRGNLIGKCKADDIKRIEREIQEFAEFKIQSLIKERSTDNG